MEKDHSRIRVRGESNHWSVLGDILHLIGDIGWKWFIEIEGVTVSESRLLISDSQMDMHALGGKRGLEFATKLKALLPEDYKSYLTGTIGIPSTSSWSFSMRLDEFDQPDEAEKLIAEYFPNLYALA